MRSVSHRTSGIQHPDEGDRPLDSALFSACRIVATAELGAVRVDDAPVVVDTAIGGARFSVALPGVPCRR